MLDATVGDRERTPTQGSGTLGPHCEPFGPVTRSLSIGAFTTLEDTDDVTALITHAADYFTAEGLTVSDVRTEPPALGAYAADEDGAPDGFEVVPDAGRIIAGGNTACLPEDGETPASPLDAVDAARRMEMEAFLDATAVAAAPDVTVVHVPRECGVGQTIQRHIDPGDAADAEAIFAAVGEYWDSQGEVVRDGTPDSLRGLLLRRDDIRYEALLAPDYGQVILGATTPDCEELIEQGRG